MRKMSVAIGILAYLLTGCAEPTSTQLLPTGPRNVIIQAKPIPTLSVSSPDNCVTTVEWDARGVAFVDHEVEVGDNIGLAVRVSPDKHATSSTVQWNPGSFHGTTNREPTGKMRAALYDHKLHVLASTDWVAVGFDCISG
jgi:hypothetical protein